MAKLLIGGVATDKEGTIVDKTNIPQAKKHLISALKLNPKNAKALYNLGKVNIIEDSYSKAKINFKKAISADKNLPTLFFLPSVMLFPALLGWRPYSHRITSTAIS